MRTLIQIHLRNAGNALDAETALQAWLADSGFRPAIVDLSEEVRLSLLTNDEPALTITSGTEPAVEVVNRHAVDILRAIPLIGHERYHALNTARYVIHFDDNVHGTTVWGLVGLDAPTVRIRLRHSVSRSLERATEEVVTKVWDKSGTDGLFEPFSVGQNIPVREPRSTTDAYLGEILPPGPGLKLRAKADRQTELRTFKWVSVATGLSFLLGLLLFLASQPDSLLRWWSGAFDRLATTGAATAAVSFLSYYFHLHDLQRKPIVDWK